MKMCARRDGWNGMLYWAAIGLTLLSILCSGHGPVQRFVTGAAAAIFVLAVTGLVRRRSCLRG